MALFLLRKLDPGFLFHRHGFISRAVHVAFVMNKEALGWFSQVTSFPLCQSSFNQWTIIICCSSKCVIGQTSYHIITVSVLTWSFIPGLMLDWI